MKKIIITGSRGFLGSRLLKNYNNDLEYEVIGFSHKDLDITDKKSVKEVLLGYHPDFLIHCAAISDTGYAQEHPAETYEINVAATIQIGKMCKQIGTKLIYMSSDQVYNGCQLLGGIPEEAPLHPESVYAQQKLEMEQKVQKILPEAVGLRLTWMYDLPNRYLKTNSNLVWNILKANRQGQKLSFSSREYRGITYVWEIVDNMDKILRLPGGIYNCGSANDKTTYEIATHLAKSFGLKEIHSLITEDTQRYAEHIRNLSMNMQKIEKENIYISKTLDGIDIFLKEYGL